jgi:hypothetical protein
MQIVFLGVILGFLLTSIAFIITFEERQDPRYFTRRRKPAVRLWQFGEFFPTTRAVKLARRVGILGASAVLVAVVAGVLVVLRSNGILTAPAGLVVGNFWFRMSVGVIVGGLAAIWYRGVVVARADNLSLAQTAVLVFIIVLLLIGAYSEHIDRFLRNLSSGNLQIGAFGLQLQRAVDTSSRAEGDKAQAVVRTPHQDPVVGVGATEFGALQLIQALPNNETLDKRFISLMDPKASTNIYRYDAFKTVIDGLKEALIGRVVNCVQDIAWDLQDGDFAKTQLEAALDRLEDLAAAAKHDASPGDHKLPEAIKAMAATMADIVGELQDGDFARIHLRFALDRLEGISAAAKDDASDRRLPEAIDAMATTMAEIEQKLYDKVSMVKRTGFVGGDAALDDCKPIADSPRNLDEAKLAWRTALGPIQDDPLVWHRPYMAQTVAAVAAAANRFDFAVSELGNWLEAHDSFVAARYQLDPTMPAPDSPGMRWYKLRARISLNFLIELWVRSEREPHKKLAAYHLDLTRKNISELEAIPGVLSTLAGGRKYSAASLTEDMGHPLATANALLAETECTSPNEPLWVVIAVLVGQKQMFVDNALNDPETRTNERQFIVETLDNLLSLDPSCIGRIYPGRDLPRKFQRETMFQLVRESITDLFEYAPPGDAATRIEAIERNIRLTDAAKGLTVSIRPVDDGSEGAAVAEYGGRRDVDEILEGLTDDESEAQQLDQIRKMLVEQLKAAREDL